MILINAASITNQTFVDVLQKAATLDEVAHKAAFEFTKATCKDSAKASVTECTAISNVASH